MKSISRLSIILMSSIVLVISFNSLCMDEKQISCLFDHPNYQKRMNIIKETLVKKEIERYGIRYVEGKLRDGIKQQEFWQSLGEHNKPVFIIKKTVFRPKIKNDFLTKVIFDTIQLRKTEDSSQLPKKFLSNQIRYYQIKQKPAVLVVAKFTNKEQIQKIIDAHRSTLVTQPAILNDENDSDKSDDENTSRCNFLEQSPNLKVSVALVSTAYLLYYLFGPV